MTGPGMPESDGPRHVAKVGRNERCPCGSDKKYKDCHEKEGTAYLEKLAREEQRRRLRARRAALKEKGVPWYRRLMVR
jgi:hypothetical protein